MLAKKSARRKPSAGTGQDHEARKWGAFMKNMNVITGQDQGMKTEGLEKETGETKKDSMAKKGGINVKFTGTIGK